MSKRGLRTALATMAVAVWLSGAAPCVAQTLSAPTEQQIQSAIDLGRTDKIPTVKLNSFAGDFDVLIDGPVARIAAAASAATRRYKPFSMRDVSPEMRSPFYVVSLQRRTDSRAVGPIQNVVLQSKGSTAVETAIQPLNQVGETASFDRLPDGEFEVIVVLTSERQRYGVSQGPRKARVSVWRSA